LKQHTALIFNWVSQVGKQIKGGRLGYRGQEDWPIRARDRNLGKTVGTCPI